MRNVRLACVLLALWPGTSLAQTTASDVVSGQPPEAAAAPYNRFHEFIHNTIKSPAFHVEAFGAALIDQANGFPKEWDSGGQPFLKRNAARFGQAFTASIIEASAAEAMHYHVGYERCGCSGAMRRFSHAVVHTFVVRHVDGHIVLNTPFLMSRYGSAAVANAWYPESYKVADVMSQGTFSLGSAVGLNVLDEFAPDILHLVRLH
jgi:hypothetical protein